MLHLALIILDILLLNLINLLCNLLLRWLNLVKICRRNLLARRVLHLDLLGALRHLALCLELLLLRDDLLLLVVALVLALVLLLVRCLHMLKESVVHWLIRSRCAHALIINLCLYLSELSCLLIEIRSHARCLQQLHGLQRLLLVLRRADVLARSEEVVCKWLLDANCHGLEYLSERRR